MSAFALISSAVPPASDVGSALGERLNLTRLGYSSWLIWKGMHCNPGTPLCAILARLSIFTLAARAGVIHDLEAGRIYGGAPAVPKVRWRRQTVALTRLEMRTASR